MTISENDTEDAPVFSKMSIAKRQCLKEFKGLSVLFNRV
jgi:hypothetical protein